MSLQKIKVLTSLALSNLVFSIQVAGQINSIGTICPYLLSYYSSIDSKTSLSSILFITTIAYIFETLTTFLAFFLSMHYSEQSLMACSLFGSVVIVLASLYFSNPWFFYIAFGISLGFNTNFLGYCPTFIGWKVMKNNKGFVSGFRSSFYIMGPFVLGLLFALTSNPENKKGIVTGNIIYFDEEIYEKVPFSLICMCFLNLVLGSISLLLLWGEKSEQKQQKKSSLTVLKVLKQKTFWYMFFSMYFKIFFYYFLISIYKNFGLYYFNDDHFMNLVSFIAFGGCSIGKVVFGSLFDVFNWDTLSLIFIFTEIFFTIIGPFTTGNKLAFTIWLSSALSVSGISYISILVLSFKYYPNCNWVISLVAVSLIFDIFTVNLFINDMVDYIGYSNCFYLTLVFHLVALLIVYLKPYLTEEYKEEEPLLDKEKL